MDEMVGSFKKRLSKLNTFLRTQLDSHLSENHSPEAMHCIAYLTSVVLVVQEFFAILKVNVMIWSIKMNCESCNERFYIQSEIQEIIDKGKPPNSFQTRLDKCFDHMDKYIGHLIRSHIQKKAHNRFLSKLNNKNVLVIMDFKMKFQWKILKEEQSSYFGKSGNSILGLVFLYKKRQ